LVLRPCRPNFARWPNGFAPGLLFETQQAARELIERQKKVLLDKRNVIIGLKT